MQAVHLNQIASAYSDSNLATLRKSLIELDTKLDMDRLSYLFTYLRDKILETLDGFDELVRLSEQLGRIEDEEIESPDDATEVEAEIKDQLAGLSANIHQVGSQLIGIRRHLAYIVGDAELKRASRTLNEAHKKVAAFYTNNIATRLEDRDDLRVGLLKHRDRWLGDKNGFTESGFQLRALNPAAYSVANEVAAELKEQQEEILEDLTKLILGYLEERFYPLLIEKGLQIPYRFRIGIVQKPVKDKESLSEARIAYEFKPEWWEQFQEKVSAVEFDNFERDLYSNPIKSPE